MAQGKLTAADVAKLTQPGMYLDGGGLYLQVKGATQRSWVYRYSIDGKARWLGLGSAREISLAKARERRDKHQVARRDGADPVADRKSAVAQRRVAELKRRTFRDYAGQYVADHRQEWGNPKHAGQWMTTLARFVYPAVGDRPVAEVDTAAVLECLRPIWTKLPETASRVRGRVEKILDAAKVEGLRDGDNPARWRNHLQLLLPAPGKIRTVVHHAALPYREMPAVFADLRAAGGVSARALEFTILTAARTGETLGADWTEINLAEQTWTIPARRMKARREHRVPLCDRALEILGEARAFAGADSAPVFGNRGAPLSNMAMTATLKRMGRSAVTVHGFRSTFRDWAAEITGFPSEVVEMALAHAIGSDVEAAYRRGDLFEKRRELMREWARYCVPGASTSEATT
jgi:integrase